MRNPVETTIGACQYRYTPLPAGRGLKVLARVAKLAGPALARLAETNLSGVANALRNGSDGSVDFAGAIEALVERVDGEELAWLCKELATQTMVRGPHHKGFVRLDDQFDDHFCADYLSMFHWLKWCLEVDLGPLFRGLQANAAPRVDSGTTTT